MSDQEARRLAEGLPAKERDRVTGMPYDLGWVEAKVYEPLSGGHKAWLLVSRAPAQFWRVCAPDIGLDLSTGSGMGGLATAIAEAVAAGMLGVESDEEAF